MSTPTVSILMAVHNGKHFLPATMRSMLEQTFTDFEFVIIDDGSTDGVTRMLQKYAESDSRIRLIVQENLGLTRTLNRGLDLCRAPLIARMDADDIARPTRIKQQVDYMTHHPEVVLLGGAYELVDDRGRLLTTLKPALDNATLQQQCLEGTTPICHPLSMFRRKTAIDVGGYDETYAVAQDLDLWLRLGERGQLACLPSVLLQYRMHAKSLSEAKQHTQVENMRRACTNAWARRGITGELKGEGGWRATGDGDSRIRQALKFGWWAFNSGEKGTARAYGLKVIRNAPTNSEGWRLVYAATFKEPPIAKPIRT